MEYRDKGLTVNPIYNAASFCFIPAPEERSMKIIPPSFEILDDLDQQSLAIRIEACGRICYKSEDKITESSAEPFIRKIIKHGHNSVAEMAVVTIRVAVENEAAITALLATVPRYLRIDRLDALTLLITGSVRGFREICLFHPEVPMVQAISAYLAARHPLFYFDLTPADGWKDRPGINVEKVPLAEVEQLAPELLARHRHMAVKFVVNRAITHEIVRHRPCSYLQESQRYCRYSESKFDNQVTFIKPLFFEEGGPEFLLWEEAMRETERLYLKLLSTSTPQAARTVLPNSCKTELIAFANLVEWRHIFKLRTSAAAEPSMRSDDPAFRTIP